jgi:hypothetical protein
MLCEYYKDALIDAAASGVALSGELREHLAECASCRATFAQEQSLFAAIDTGLHAAANAGAPPSLLPPVRARLDEVATPRLAWVQPLVFASAGVALALVVFLMARPHRVAREEAAKQGLVAIPASTSPVVNTNRQETSSEGHQIALLVHHSRTSQNSTKAHSAASSNPEVLVPPDERDGLAQLVASLNEYRGLATALLARVPEKNDSLIGVDRLQIDALEIKPLEGRETETLDSAGGKH